MREKSPIILADIIADKAQAKPDLSLTHGNAQMMTLGMTIGMDTRSVFSRKFTKFVPSYLQVVPEIPKTASEKPQTRFLLEQFKPNGEGIYTEVR